MKKTMKKTGIFITFEGGDGAGKTTLIEKIYSDLTKHTRNVLKTRAPGGTEIGQEIRNLVLHKHDARLSKRSELLLFLSDRAQHVDELILPALHKGKIVLCDRFNDSTIAYQSGARGFKEDWVYKLCQFACDGLEPNLTLYLDLDPKIAFARAKKAGLTKDRIESETLKFHQKIRKAFKQIAKKYPKRFIILDASKTPEEVYTQAKVRIDALLQNYRK
jgi:dTMP kinase